MLLCSCLEWNCSEVRSRYASCQLILCFLLWMWAVFQRHLGIPYLRKPPFSWLTYWSMVGRVRLLKSFASGNWYVTISKIYFLSEAKGSTWKLFQLPLHTMIPYSLASAFISYLGSSTLPSHLSFYHLSVYILGLATSYIGIRYGSPLIHIWQICNHGWICGAVVL